jgi:hypothetical protein
MIWLWEEPFHINRTYRLAPIFMSSPPLLGLIDHLPDEVSNNPTDSSSYTLHPEDGGNLLLQSIGIRLQDYTVSQPKKKIICLLIRSIFHGVHLIYFM